MGERLQVKVEKWDQRHWAVYDGSELVCLTVYKKGALEVKRRLENVTLPRVGRHLRSWDASIARYVLGLRIQCALVPLDRSFANPAEMDVGVELSDHHVLFLSVLKAAKTSSLVVKRRCKQRTNPSIAQPKSRPEKNGDVDGEKSVSEEGASDAHMRGDRAAQVARP